MLKNVLKIFQMSEQYWGCLDKMSEVNFSPAETLTLFNDSYISAYVMPFWYFNFRDLFRLVDVWLCHVYASFIFSQITFRQIYNYSII